MGVLERDPDETAATLERWLTARTDVASPVVTDVSIPGGTGWSNETIFFTASWTRDGVSERSGLVARIAPSEYQVFPDDTFDRQYTIMRALAAHSDVPMPAIGWFEDDAGWFGRPFWIMDRVDGDIATDAPPYAGEGWLADATVEQRRATWWNSIDAMAKVHTLDVASLHLPAGTFPQTSDTLNWHLDHQERFLTWAEDGTPHEAARRALAWLRAHRPGEPAEGPTLTWGDSRFSNLIFRDFAVLAVLDWEMAGIGDPLMDLAWWIFADEALTVGSGCTRLDGFPSAEETGAWWAERTGRSADALDYHLRFAAFRFTVIMVRMGKLLHGVGFVPPEFAYDNLISQAMERMFTDD